MTALRKLIEAVEAERPEDVSWRKTLPNNWPDAWFAYNGSLDAAKTLHQALLPGCNQASVDWGPSGCGATATWWPDGLSGNREIVGKGYDHCPARALLAAILKAYEART